MLALRISLHNYQLCGTKKSLGNRGGRIGHSHSLNKRIPLIYNYRYIDDISIYIYIDIYRPVFVYGLLFQEVSYHPEKIVLPPWQ